MDHVSWPGCVNMETVVLRKYAKLSEAMLARFIFYLTDIFFMVLRADFFFSYTVTHKKSSGRIARKQVSLDVYHTQRLYFLAYVSLQ